MTDAQSEPSYELVMPFVTVTDAGGPHNGPAYAAGWEMGSLDALLEHTRPAVHQQTIRAENMPQADLLAMKHGYRATVTQAGDQWSFVTLERTETT